MTNKTDFEMEYVNEEGATEYRVYRIEEGDDFTRCGEWQVVVEVDAENDLIRTAIDGNCDDEYLNAYGIREVWHLLPANARIA